MRNLFDIDVEHPAGRKIYRPGVHQIAFEKNFDPASLFRDGNDQPGGILDRHGFFILSRRQGSPQSVSNAAASRTVLPEEVRGRDSRSTILSGTLKFARLARKKVRSSFSTR